MSRPGSIRRADGSTARRAVSLALAIAAGLGSCRFLSIASGQQMPPVAAPNPSLSAAPDAAAPGTAVVGDNATADSTAPAIPPDVQIVRFSGPDGVRIEVLGPSPEPAPVGDGRGLATLGFKVGVPYRLRVSNLPDRPSAELFPVVEVVGHLHRPSGINPGKYPIRIVFSEDNFEQVADRGRFVTQVIYLEDPDQALPITLPKDQIPVVTLNPTEDPLKVGAALGRVMAIVRMGGRRPMQEELNAEALGFPGANMGPPCPFTAGDGGRCTLACGPVCGTPPPPGRPWAPRDEYLCDGGDREGAAHVAGDGGLTGIDPRDAVMRFDDGKQLRTLPTNVVCVYAPRFAEVRTSVGPNEALKVESPVRTKYLEKEATEEVRQEAKRMVQNQGAEAARNRARPSGLTNRVRAGVHSDLRVLSGYDDSIHVAGNIKVQAAERARARQRPVALLERIRLDGIKLAEGTVISGVAEGASVAVMTWTPRETVGVETPPGRPGVVIVKRVSAGEAEPGDVLTYLIQYRNMGNVPIRAVSIIDSLLPRLEYVAGSARGPKGTIFTSEENQVGSTELHWELPDALAPGAAGYVSFQAIVR
jgi:uncharacterized repeat protein (TIGR01451 family)